MDVWGKLWDLATDGPDEPATISVDPEDSGRVLLTWPDGSKGAWYWYDGDWRPSEGPPPYDAATATGMYDRE